MSYTAPAGNAVNFQFDGASYAAPAGNAVAFDFAEEAVLTCAGTISVSGNAALSHGVTLDSTGTVLIGGAAVFPDFWHGWIQIGGKVTLLTHSPLNVSGKVTVLGLASILTTAPLRLSGSVNLAGSTRINRGNRFVAFGKLRVCGGANVSVGRTFSAQGHIVVTTGVAQLQHGVTFTAGGNIRVGGRASLSTLPAFAMSCVGRVEVIGEVRFSVKRTNPLPHCFVLTRSSRTEVITHGV